MDNAFAVRRRRGPSGRYCIVDADSFTPFYHKCSFSKRYWDFLVAVRMESRKQLGCRGKFNGRTKYSHNYGFNQEFFLYLHYKLGPHLDEDQLLLLQHSSMKPMKVTDPDLSNRNKRVREKHSIFRAVEEPAIKRIRESCGILGVANPDPAPSLSEGY